MVLGLQPPVSTVETCTEGYDIALAEFCYEASDDLSDAMDTCPSAPIDDWEHLASLLTEE